MVDRWSTLVDPEEGFQPVNIGIHGIRPGDVAGAPTMPQLRQELRRRLRGEVLVSHGPFDRVAFRHAMQKYGLQQLQVYWIDSIMVAKRAWYDDSEIQSFGLAPLASHLDILFNHHVAIEDAEVAAKIMMKACEYRKVTVDYWLTAVEKPIPKSERRAIEKKVSVQRENRNPTPTELIDGPLSGERIVFTSSISMTRTEAKAIALRMGCEVGSGVTQRTTILVVGIQSSSQIN